MGGKGDCTIRQAELRDADAFDTDDDERLHNVEELISKAADYDETAAKYDPEKLSYGFNTVDGEEIYFIPNPALGLWIDREGFQA